MPAPVTADELLDALAEVCRVQSASRWRDIARPEQLPPPGEWTTWVLLGGRGMGKTRALTEWVCEQAESMPGSRGALVAATAADVRDTLIEGDSGVLRVAKPDFRPLYEPSKRRLTWPNGTTATLFSAEKADRLRGPQYHWAAVDELAAWPSEEPWDMLLFGLRLRGPAGEQPRVAVATTPRPRGPLLKVVRVEKDEDGRKRWAPIDEMTRLSVGTTYDNVSNLADSFLTRIVARYEGTRLGRQELEAGVVDDVPGALWTWDMLEMPGFRVEHAPPLVRVVVGVDPKIEAGADSETGIVAMGIDGQSRPHLWALRDDSIDGSPAQWARAACRCYWMAEADFIIPEVNQGGDMVVSTIHGEDRSVRVKTVRATRGKYIRAEPVAALAEQGRIHHVGPRERWARLEDQLTSWSPGDRSPDRLDAYVWAATALDPWRNVVDLDTARRIRQQAARPGSWASGFKA